MFNDPVVFPFTAGVLPAGVPVGGVPVGGVPTGVPAGVPLCVPAGVPTGVPQGDATPKPDVVMSCPYLPEPVTAKTLYPAGVPAEVTIRVPAGVPVSVSAGVPRLFARTGTTYQNPVTTILVANVPTSPSSIPSTPNGDWYKQPRAERRTRTWRRA